MQRYPETHMHDLERDKHKAFEHYRQSLDKLHWQTRPELDR